MHFMSCFCLWCLGLTRQRGKHTVPLGLRWCKWEPRLLFYVSDCLSMLFGFHLISVANTFPFLQFSLGFNNWTCLAWLLHHKKRKKNMTSLLWRHDLTTSLGLDRPSHKQRTTQPTWVTLVFLVFFRYNLKTRFSLAETVFASIYARCSFACETGKVKRGSE